MANCEIIIIGKIKGNPNLMMASIYNNYQYAPPYQNRIKTFFLMNLSFLHFYISTSKNEKEFKEKFKKNYAYKLCSNYEEERYCDWSFLEKIEDKELKNLRNFFDIFLKNKQKKDTITINEAIKTINNKTNKHNNFEKILKQELDPLIDFWS